MDRLTQLKLRKSDKNPIIIPRQGKEWEINGTFNPGATIDRGTIHLLYRAVDTNMISNIGYVQTRNGVEINFRSSDPVLSPLAEYEEFGCEDTRITNFDGKFYITYTAYSRRGPRIALASTKDFRNFTKYGIIGPNYMWPSEEDSPDVQFKQDGQKTVLYNPSTGKKYVLFSIFSYSDADFFGYEDACAK